MDQSLPYHVYVLRCWAERSDQRQGLLWRYSLQEVGTGQRRGFTDLEMLVKHLLKELDHQVETNQQKGHNVQDLSKTISDE